MKFACDKCNTKYSIADERVRGRILKIRCKTCDHVISVREPGVEAEPEPEPDLPPHANLGDGGSEHTVVGGFPMAGFADSLFESKSAAEPAATASSAPADAKNEDWYVSFDGEQEGPYSLKDARERVRGERKSGKEVHVWRADFFVWLAVEEVPEFAVALKPEPKPSKQPAATASLSSAPASSPPLPSIAATQSSSSSARANPRRGSSSSPVSASSGATASATQRAPDPEAQEPRVDTKPVALPPPPELMTATPLVLPLTSAPAVPLVEGSPGADIPGQMTKPEPRLSRRALEEPGAKKGGVDKVEAKKESELKSVPPAKDAAKSPAPSIKKGEPFSDVKPAVTPNELADRGAVPLTVNPLDTSPIPLPPPPGGEAIGDVSDLARLPDPKVRRKNPFTEPNDAAGPSAMPVVVVTGNKNSTLLKVAVAVLLVAVIVMGVVVVKMMKTPPVEPAKPVETASTGQHVVEQPIALPDDAPQKPTTTTPVARPADKKPVAAGGKKGAPIAKPVAGKPGPNLSSDQKNLASLYNDDTEKSAPRAVGNDNGRAATQVSQTSILAVVTQNRRALNTCYDRVLKHDSSLKRARVVTHVAIGISGSVLRVTIPDPTYATSEIGQCLIQSIKRWRFPSGDSEYETEFPILLQAE